MPNGLSCTKGERDSYLTKNTVTRHLREAGMHTPLPKGHTTAGMAPPSPFPGPLQTDLREDPVTDIALLPEPSHDAC